ncbi:hypothetical protein [Marinovum algicola]|uniref:hypothetical protein n=1 Tax=Marinovum algicola TaxID=42444 RepID=UPI003B519E37
MVLDQIVERHEGALGAVLVDRLLDQVAADDVGQIAGGEQQVHRLVVVLGVAARGLVDQVDIGFLAGHFLDRVELRGVAAGAIALVRAANACGSSARAAPR